MEDFEKLCGDIKKIVLRLPNVEEREKAGVCVECEAVPVFKVRRCQKCYEKFRDRNRQEARQNRNCVPRKMWSPERQAYILIDEREAYDDLQAQVAREIESGMSGPALCQKYKTSMGRLQRICQRYGVRFKGKVGGNRIIKTPERIALEEKILADARAGMYLRDLKKKYPGVEVRYVCVRNNVQVAKTPVEKWGEEVPGLDTRAGVDPAAKAPVSV